MSGGDQTSSRIPVSQTDLLRTLNDLNSIDLERSKRAKELEPLRTSLRQKLPPDILIIHDKLLAEGRRSVASRFANACTECLGEVLVKGSEQRIGAMFVQCPHCGTLLYG